MPVTAYFMQNNSRRRTPGGVFLMLVKQDGDIQQEKLNLIFTDERKKTSMMKKRKLPHSRKARAEELRKSLSAGMFCLIM
jgi:phosphorylated adapter RNA export protein